jgi:type VI secretion system secreted protein Hcp
MPGQEILPSPEYYLKIPEIKGDALHKEHQGDIPVTSFSLGGSRAASLGAASGQNKGHVAAQDIAFTAAFSSASPVLMSYMSSGKRIKSATLVCRQTAGPSSKIVLTIELTDVYVSSYQVAGHGGEGGAVPQDQFTLNYGKIEIRYSGNKPDGSPGKSTTGSWDLRTNEP